MCCRKNWTSSWTVLQGSTLLFAKGQGGGTSWVSDRNLLLKVVSCQQSRIVFRQKSLKLAVSVFEWFVGPLDGSWGWIFSLLRVSFSISLPSAPSPSVFLVFLVFTPLRPPSMQPYYHSGSFPEFLLSLLSDWKPSAKKRPAVSYGCSELDRASSVCAASFLLCAPHCPPLHATSLLSAMLWPQPHCVFLVTGMDRRFRTILLCYCSFTLWLGWTLNRRIDLYIIGEQVMFLPRRVTRSSWTTRFKEKSVFLETEML